MALSRSGARRAVAKREVKDLGHCTTLFLRNDALSPFLRFLLVLPRRNEKRASHIRIEFQNSNARDGASFELYIRGMRIPGGISR